MPRIKGDPHCILGTPRLLTPHQGIKEPTQKLNYLSRKEGEKERWGEKLKERERKREREQSSTPFISHFISLE